LLKKLAAEENHLKGLGGISDSSIINSNNRVSEVETTLTGRAWREGGRDNAVRLD